MTDEHSAAARRHTQALAEAQGLDLRRALAAVQDAYAGHARDALLLRNAVAPTDEPVTVFRPLKSEAGADGTRERD